MKHVANTEGFCAVCGADLSSSLTGGSACEGAPLVDIIEEDGTVRARKVPLNEALPEPDDYADAMSYLMDGPMEYSVGGGAAPFVTLRRVFA